MVWRLFLNDKVKLSELEHLSIDDVQLANQALDVWIQANESS